MATTTIDIAELRARKISPRLRALGALQPLLTPQSTGTQSLYVRERAGRITYVADGIQLEPFAQLSFNTFFNSFYEAYWVEYTSIRGIQIAFQGSGRLWCSVFRQSAEGEPCRICCELVDLSRVTSASVKVQLQDRATGEPGRLYIELYASDTGAKLDSISWKTDSKPVRDASLGIVICSYNREAIVTRTAAALAMIAPEASVNRIIVVNQGSPFRSPQFRELQLTHRDLVQVIEQPNHGGSGGFTRGALELLKDGVSTHVLFLDDDTELEPRHVATAVSFHRFATDPLVAGGQMLNSHKPTWIFDSGGRIENNRMYANHRTYDLTTPESLHDFARVARSDFSGWWFTIFPVEYFREYGLPLPTFIHVDDVEYGMRLTEAGIRTVVVPPVAIWHEPYIDKPPCVYSYYDARNWAVFSSLYPNRLRLKTPRALLREAFGLLIRYDYHQLLSLTLGLEQFLRGPVSMDEDASETHARLARLLNPYAREEMPSPPALPVASEAVPRRPSTVRLRLLITFIRMLAGYPARNSAGRECIARPDMPLDFMHLGRSYVLTKDNRYFIRFRYSRANTWRLGVQSVKTAVRYALRRDSAAGLWRSARSELASPKKWAARFRNLRQNT